MINKHSKILLITIISLFFGQHYTTAQDFTPGKESYNYFTLGLGPTVPIPNIGLGYRQRNLHHGYDLSVNGSTAIGIHMIQGKVLYHYYLDDLSETPVYTGIGGAVGCIFQNKGRAEAAISPSFVIGKQLSCDPGNKRFIEVHIDVPTFTNRDFTAVPFIYFKYGFSF